MKYVKELPSKPGFYFMVDYADKPPIESPVLVLQDPNDNGILEVYYMGLENIDLIPDVHGRFDESWWYGPIEVPKIEAKFDKEGP